LGLIDGKEENSVALSTKNFRMIYEAQRSEL
jgi:hypothetical protein